MRFFLSLLTVIGLGASGAHASDLRFKFNNPSFGGDPMRASHLMKLMDAQKQPVPVEKDTILQFTEDLERRLLSGLATEITSQIFGQDGATEGAFFVGGLEVTYETLGGDVVVTLSDATGTTEIVVPAF